jgi:hypothetical protein
MKKILLSVSMIMIASAAFAQLTPGTWFLGGELQFYSNTNSTTIQPNNITNSSTTTLLNISPSIGVQLCKHWEVGLEVGYSTTSTTYSTFPSSNTTSNEFTVGPFAKYFHPFTENSSFYYQFLGSVNLGFENGSNSSIDSVTGSSPNATNSTVTISITPGLAWNPVKHFIFDLYYGSISYSTKSTNNGDGIKTTNSGFNFNITPGTLVFGVEYVFPSGKSK